MLAHSGRHYLAVIRFRPRKLHDQKPVWRIACRADVRDSDASSSGDSQSGSVPLQTQSRRDRSFSEQLEAPNPDFFLRSVFHGRLWRRCDIEQVDTYIHSIRP